MENLPAHIPLIFSLTTILTLALFLLTISRSGVAIQSITKIALLLVVWLIVQAVLTIKEVYSSDTTSLPPKILLFGILPLILAIIIIFATHKGRKFVDSLPLFHLTCLHIVRIPVELVLFWLFLHKAVPGLMTFEGRNFDIVAGITAPFIAYLGLKKSKPYPGMLLVWNFISLGLLLNIVVNAFLSAPSPLQQFAFDQPNVAILHFPFSWLPTFVVPVVLFSHLASIRQLMRGIKQ